MLCDQFPFTLLSPLLFVAYRESWNAVQHVSPVSVILYIRLAMDLSRKNLSVVRC